MIDATTPQMSPMKPRPGSAKLRAQKARAKESRTTMDKTRQSGAVTVPASSADPTGTAVVVVTVFLVAVTWYSLMVAG